MPFLRRAHGPLGQWCQRGLGRRRVPNRLRSAMLRSSLWRRGRPQCGQATLARQARTCSSTTTSCTLASSSLDSASCKPSVSACRASRRSSATWCTAGGTSPSASITTCTLILMPGSSPDRPSPAASRRLAALRSKRSSRNPPHSSSSSPQRPPTTPPRWSGSASRSAASSSMSRSGEDWRCSGKTHGPPHPSGGAERRPPVQTGAPTPLDRQDRFQPYVVAPAVEDVVLVEEPFADAQAEIGKLDLIRVVPEPETARVGNAVLTAVDDEAVQVLVAPAEGELEGGVEVGDRAGGAD